MTCTNLHSVGMTNQKLRRKCGHEFCVLCRQRSLPERSSDFWVCCRCNNLNLYNPQKHKADCRARQRRHWGLELDETFIECSWPGQETLREKT